MDEELKNVYNKLMKMIEKNDFQNNYVVSKDVFRKIREYVLTSNSVFIPQIDIVMKDKIFFYFGIRIYLDGELPEGSIYIDKKKSK